MKAVLLAAVVAMLSACAASQDAKPGESDALTRLRLEIERDKNKMVGLFNELTNKNIYLEKKVTSLENEVSTYRVDLKRVRSELDNLRTAQGGGTKTDPPVNPNEKQIPTEEARMRAELAVSDLKRGGVKLDDVVNDMKPIASVASIIFMEAVAKNPTDTEFVKLLENVIVRLPAEFLRLPLQEALGKPGTARASSARIIGRVADFKLSTLLEGHTADADLYFCFEVGRAMLACKNRLGVPALLRALRSEDEMIRMLAISSLKAVNKGDTLGYDYKKDVVDNSAAVKSWGDWWDTTGKKLFE